MHWHKARIKGHYILEIKIHQVEKSSQYPEGLKYGLICKDLRSQRQVLMDNHHPKGHHIHLGEESEMPYSFRGIDALIDDFEALVLENLRVKL